MSFNIDDPLAGILSDGSDDSFFDDDILGKKNVTKKKTTPTHTADKKNTLFDLGEVKHKPNIADAKKDSVLDFENSEPKKVSAVDDLRTKSETKSPTPFHRTVSKDSINIQNVQTKSKNAFDKQDFSRASTKTAKLSSSADKLDIMDDKPSASRRETLKPLEKGKSSQSLFDDILGGSSTKTSGSTNQITRPTTAAKSQDFDFDAFLGKSESKHTLSKSAPQKPDAKVDIPTEETIVKKGKSSEDWLGIFESKDEDENDEGDSGMPAWLGVDNKKNKSVDQNKQSKEVIAKEIKPQNEKNDAPVPKVKETEIELKVEKFMPKNTNMLQNSNEDLTSEGAALYLQQQESQLMVALQLKAQEEKLAAMQTRQKETQRVQREAAQAQHAQLDAMLQKQAEQRQQMQNIIASHQERITQRIKDLLSTTDTDHDYTATTNHNDFDKTQPERQESPHMREKKQLLQLVQSLQENHDKEIDLMETSYRRQLAFLELSVNQSEERMKDESDKLVKFYMEKLSWLEEHHQLYKKLNEENLVTLIERHRSENDMLRQQHLENIKVLQEHHGALMENMKNSVQQEQVLIRDSTGFSTDLQQLVVDMKESKSYCSQLVEKVRVLTENTQKDIDKSLGVRESQINDMIQQLKKERENFDAEKNESREMIKMLESRLKQMTTMIEEETSALKQKKMEFEFEKATFSKQTEFAKNVLKKQDEEIKLIKEDIQKEYKEQKTKIEEEKAKALRDSTAVAKEKVSIQNLKQELEKTKAELEAQLEEITEERSKLNVEKQQMHMEEQRIVAKSRDLDLLAKTAIEKQSQAENKYSEAEFIQRKYEDRIRRIQEHVVSLNSREKQIAREKVALSRERLSLHNERKQLDNKQQCSLCKSNQSVSYYNYEGTYTLPENFLQVPVSRDGNINSSTNAIEQEIARIMGRNYALGNSPAIDNIQHETGVEDHRNREFQAAHSSHVESGAFKDYMDPKFMMLRLDVQQVLSNLEHSKKDGDRTSDMEQEQE